jgi:amino acid adenylation domain-containing protein
MNEFIRHVTNLPLEQQMIRAKCVHPTGTFIKFKKQEIEQSIPERFEKIARLYPNQLAVKAGDRSLSYEELNQAANRIARSIVNRCDTNEEPIALLLQNNADMIASVLGVLKAGKIYVPLDALFPISRNRDLLEDSQARLIVTNSKNFSLAKEVAGNKLAFINLDELDGSDSEENLGLCIPPDARAYILYTSGSTGKPKGVVQNHRNVLHLIMRHTNRAHICPNDRIGLLRSFSVHGGTLLTLAALLNGATLLPFDVKREGVRELAHWLRREGITLCRIGPSLFRYMVAFLSDKDHFTQLREVSFSGEPLHTHDVEMCRKHFSADCVIVNSFGATEVSSCCEYMVERAALLDDGIVPCGYPTADMEISLLDDHGNQNRFGEIGEIAVKSRHLALGYWRNPELTRARFLPVPRSEDEHVYLTGDVGRLLPDGRLAYLGRKDFQIKVRGYRVEVEEVEALLLSLDNIKEAIVMGTEDPRGEKRLVAYIVPERKPPPSTTALRRALREKLPDHMIPAGFVVLDVLPLTPNGKINRRALPAPARSRPNLDTPFVAPRTPIEEALVKVWTKVLGIDEVGTRDNFFDLGGHSLTATQVLSHVINKFRLEIPLRLLFQSPTITEMAAVITEHQTKKLDENEMERILTELESLTDEEAHRFLSTETEMECKKG